MTLDTIDENTAKELKERSEDYLIKEKENIKTKLKDLGVDQNLMSHKGLTPGMLLTLGEKKIKTLKDFAELSTDELVGFYDEKKGQSPGFGRKMRGTRTRAPKPPRAFAAPSAIASVPANSTAKGRWVAACVFMHV